MKVKVSDEVFNKLEDVRFGVVIAKGIDNNCYKEEMTNLLNDNIKRVEEYYLNKKLPSINPIVDLGNSIKTRRWIYKK